MTFAISRDNVLPFSSYFRHLSKNKIPVNAAILVYLISVAITTAVIGSVMAFTAITATYVTILMPVYCLNDMSWTLRATIATNFSYLIPIVARHTIGRNTFESAAWNLGRSSPFLGLLAALYIMFLFVVLLLPQVFPVTAVRSPEIFRDLLLSLAVSVSARQQWRLTVGQQTLNYAPIMIGGITVISLVGWALPFGLGGRHWVSLLILATQSNVNADKQTVQWSQEDD